MKKLTRPLVIIGLGVLTILLLVRLGKIDISLQTLRGLKLHYLLLAVLIHYSGFVLRGWRWQLLLAGLGYQLRYSYVTALLLSGWFVSALVPARAGDLARIVMLRRDHQIDLAAGSASLAAERAFDILAILLLAALASLWALRDRTPPWIWQTIGAGLALFLLTLVVLFSVPRLQSRLQTLLPWSFYQKGVHFGFELLAAVRRLGQKPGLLLTVILQSLAIWLCDVFLMYFAFLSIGVVAPLSVSAFSSMAVDLAAAVPLVPGAVGQFEAAAVGTLALFGIGPAQSSLMILLNRFISFWTFILCSGLVTYLFGFTRMLKSETSTREQTLASELSS